MSDPRSYYGQPVLKAAATDGHRLARVTLPRPDGAGFKLERFDFITSNRVKEFAGSDWMGQG